MNVVIVGGGIVGCSIAYHLAQLGWRDILVLDKGPLFHNDGSTSHAPGILGLVTGSPTLTNWAKYSAQLYKTLGCFHRVGGIDVALTAVTQQELQRRYGLALARGLPAQFITHEEAESLFPHLYPNAKSLLYHKHDGITHGPTICAALAEQCGDAVSFRANTAVSQLKVNGGRITAVVTASGEAIKADHVVLATNIWGALLAEQVGITIPMLAAQHQYVITSPLPKLADEIDEIRMPNLRYFDYGIYVRQHFQAYGFGSYFHAPRMVQAGNVGKTGIKPFTKDDFAPAWELMQTQLPACKGADFAQAFNGMFGFTVDDKPILGETPIVRGLWFALGAWVTHAGGVGQTMARWLAHGTPDCDIHEANINRFHAHHHQPNYIAHRSATHYAQHLRVIHPKAPWGMPRNIHHAPYHERLKALGGVFDEFAGWEMAQWYEANEKLLDKYAGQIPQRDEWGARHWSPICAAEHLATRENGGLFNINGLTRIEVAGKGATAFLNHVCANQVDKPIHKIVYTTMLNSLGKIMADLIVVRLEAERYLLITSTLHGQHDLAWLRLHQPEDVIIKDVSSQWSGVAIWGPKAERVLRPLTQTNLSISQFPYYTAQQITINNIPALALRMSFVGELGWELHVAQEDALALWDTLWAAGQSHGIVAAGSVALDSLSKEKGYLIFGHDINGDYSPHEAGLGWAVKDTDFLGNAALLEQKKAGVKKRLRVMTFDTAVGFALGGEPILLDGQAIGYVASANGGYSVGKHIAYGYLPIEQVKVGTKLHIEYLGQRYPVTVAKSPLFDPQNLRIRGSE